MKRFFSAWNLFWMTPASPKPLGLLRIGVALILLVQVTSVAPHFFQVYGNDGILQGTLRQHFGQTDLPGLYELSAVLSSVGIPESTTLCALAGVFLLSVGLLLVGYQTKTAAVFVWLSHYFLTGGHLSSYGLDTFMNISLFYFLWMPIDAAYSVDVALGRTHSDPTPEARVAMRFLQLHMSVVYLASGIDKAAGIQWWNGEAIWRSLLLPVYAHGDFSWLAKYPMLAKLGAWGTLLVECGYPVGMWVPKLRKLTVLAVMALHLGIFIFLGLHLFALMMMLLSFCAFGAAELPRLYYRSRRSVSSTYPVAS